MSNSLNYLGIARKANKLEIGEDFTAVAARTKKARIIVVASDASDNAKRKAANFSQTNNIPIVELKYTRQELGTVLDKAFPAMAAITDIGIASAFINKLKEESVGYEALAEELAVKAEKTKRRRKESLADGKNAKMAKRRKKV